MNQICNRCINDQTIPGIEFDKNGICNHCSVHENLCKTYPTGPSGQKILKDYLNKIKEKGQNKKYNCVIGISGGRDSTYTLYLAKKKWGLRPLAVHFNDGFGNPVAGENMKKATEILQIDTITMSSDWRESKDIRVAFLKASTPDLNQGNDLGIAATLYAAAVKYDIKSIIIGQSFRTEGIAPLVWNFLDGKYLKAVHKLFGKRKLSKWKPTDPGYNLGLYQMFYYSIIKQLKVYMPLYFENYIRDEASIIISKELKWENPGFHYYDDLYQTLCSYILRKKFKIDRRIYNNSALVRSGQLKRSKALELVSKPSKIEDPKVLNLCIKRLGLKQEEFENILRMDLKTFKDYPNNYYIIKFLKLPIWLLSRINMIPKVTFEKYFKLG